MLCFCSFGVWSDGWQGVGILDHPSIQDGLYSGFYCNDLYHIISSKV